MDYERNWEPDYEEVMAALKQGPNTGTGPVAGELTVMKAKSIGVTPGFWIRDSAGVSYILKFDPVNNPELATAAEIISTKLLYAIGYNVPENYLFRLDRSRLKISKKATYTDELGKKKTLTEADLDQILAKVHRQEDGLYRCLASKFLPGKPKGGFFSTARAKMTQTTSFRTNIGATCAASGCLLPGWSTTTSGPETPLICMFRKADETVSATT